MNTLIRLSEREIQETIASSLGIGFRHESPQAMTAVRSEMLRTAIWSHWRVSQSGLSTLSALYRAQKVSEAMRQIATDRDEDSEWDLLHETLAGLEMVGDVWRTKGEGWYPTPLRFVHHFEQLLLIGGCPFKLLPPVITRRIEHHGFARWIANSDPHRIADDFNIGIQTFDSWIGRPTKTLEELLTHVMTIALDSELDAHLSWDVYSPTASRKDFLAEFSQGRRWLEINQRIPNGRHVIRAFDSRHGRVAFIANIHNGTVTARSAQLVEREDYERLPYVIDRLENIPLTIEWSSISSSANKLIQRCRLPMAMERILTAVSQKTLETRGRSYPRTWTITSELFDLVSKDLQSLGVNLRKINAHS